MDKSKHAAYLRWMSLKERALAREYGVKAKKLEGGQSFDERSIFMISVSMSSGGPNALDSVWQEVDRPVFVQASSLKEALVEASEVDFSEWWDDE